ncbi:MAG: hypothetical protein ACM3ML_22370 [Micromonosporaceae bacterium]
MTEAGCRRVTALVTTAHEHAVGFWAPAGYGPDPTMARHVKMLTA